jgi:hypothetical protein
LRLSETRIAADRASGGVLRVRPHLEWTGVAIQRTRGVGRRKAGPGKRIVRIERDRTLVLLGGERVRCRRSPALEVSSPEIRVIGVRVLCLPLPDPAEVIARQPKVNLVGDACTQFLLQAQEAVGSRS